MAEPPTQTNISFTEIVQLMIVDRIEEEEASIVEEGESVQGVNTDAENRRTNNHDKSGPDIKRTVVIHRELLEASSEVFKNALEQERWGWKEGEERP